MTREEYWNGRAELALRQADKKERITAMCCLPCAQWQLAHANSPLRQGRP